MSQCRMFYSLFIMVALEREEVMVCEITNLKEENQLLRNTVSGLSVDLQNLAVSHTSKL